MTMTSTDTPEDEALRVLIDRQLIQQERAMPCVVEAVSANGTTVDVIVAISKETVIEGQRIPLGDRVIRGVPIKLYGSTTLGLFVCPPIQKGDDGELIAQDRALDNWQHGAGVRMPPEMQTPRHGDFTDGMFYPGAQRSSGAIENFPTDALTLQNRTGTTVLSLKDGEIKAKIGGVEIIVTPAGIAINGNITHTGDNFQTGTFALKGDLGQQGNQIVNGTITANNFITAP
jgi:hypothetical protein